MLAVSAAGAVIARAIVRINVNGNNVVGRLPVQVSGCSIERQRPSNRSRRRRRGHLTAAPLVVRRSAFWLQLTNVRGILFRGSNHSPPYGRAGLEFGKHIGGNCRKYRYLLRKKLTDRCGLRYRLSLFATLVRGLLACYDVPTLCMLTVAPNYGTRSGIEATRAHGDRRRSAAPRPGLGSPRTACDLLAAWNYHSSPARRLGRQSVERR